MAKKTKSKSSAPAQDAQAQAPDKELQVKWTVDKQVSCIWLKFYAEQLGISQDAAPDAQAAALRSYLSELVTRLDIPYYIHGIVHDKCTNTDDLWAPSVEKPHAHLLVISNDTRTHCGRQEVCRYRISAILNKLAPLAYRPEEDKTLFYRSTSFPSLKGREHMRCVVYHTHETSAARDDDGKYQYDRSDCYTNIPAAVLSTYYDTYFAVLDAPAKIKDITNYRKIELMQEARRMGERGEDFAAWWYALPEQIRLLSGIYKQCVDEYNYGLVAFLGSSRSKEHIRCAIYINGKPQLGKSYNAAKALEALGCKTLPVSSGGTGKLDSLLPSHDAILIDDNAVKDILAMADNSYSLVYRRNNSNPVWCGRYLVITYNGDIDHYLDAYYSHSILTDEQANAVKSRFYTCTLDDQGLRVDTVSTRGDDATIRQRHTMFKSFYDAFEASRRSFSVPPNASDDIFADMFPDVRITFRRSPITMTAPPHLDDDFM